MDLAAAIAAAAQAQPSVPNAVLVPGRQIIIDGDYCAYSCAGSNDCPPAFARAAFIERFEKACFMSQSSSAVIHLSARGTDKGKRHVIATVKPYQDTRQGKTRPRNWQFLRDYLEGLPNKVESSHREADDSIAEAAYADPSNTVIYTRDKDMRQLPGWHLTWVDFHLIWVEPGTYELVGPDGLVYGSKWLWLQMIQGDAADNIPGLPQWMQPNGKMSTRGCGEGAAEKLLANTSCNEQAQSIVCAQYYQYYGDEWADRFVEQLALLWLRESPTAPVYDFFTAKNSVLSKVMDARYTAIFQATMRLKERVLNAGKVEVHADQADPLESAATAEW